MSKGKCRLYFRSIKISISNIDVIFVIYVSGSMQGEKIVQAREALRYCVNSLSNNDYFEFIRISSTIENFQGGLLPASEENKENAILE